MPNIYVGSVQYTAVTAWVASVAGDSTANGGRGTYNRPTAAAVGSERVFRCTTSGTGGGTEPVWVNTKNATTADGTIVWTECTGQELDQTAALWRAPHARARNAVAATWGVAGDVFFVAHDHAATEAAAVVITSPGTFSSPCSFICVNATTGSSMPPVSADLRTTGSESTTGANALSIFGVGNGSSQLIGLILNAGSGAVTAGLVLNNGGANHTYKNCGLNKRGTTAAVAAISANSQANGSYGSTILDNSTVSFGATGDSFQTYSLFFRWRNTAVGIAGAVIPTSLFRVGGVNFNGLLSAVGLANMAGGTLYPTSVGTGSNALEDCIIASNTIVAVSPTSPDGVETYLLNTDSGGTNYRNEKYSFSGTQVIDTTLIRTGGASDGVTGISNRITATANAKWQLPYRSIQIAQWNTITAANRTITIEGLQDPRTSTSLPTNEHVWMELSYKGSASTTLATINDATKADFLAVGANLTASAEPWDSLITARANSTVYTLGSRYKVASNTGRVFICTTAGTSAGSEPAGLAGAVDGGAVVDNTATFTAAVRFKQSVTLSAPQPAQVGYIYATVKVARASGIYYIDPELVLS